MHEFLTNATGLYLVILFVAGFTELSQSTNGDCGDRYAAIYAPDKNAGSPMFENSDLSVQKKKK